MCGYTKGRQEESGSMYEVDLLLEKKNLTSVHISGMISKGQPLIKRKTELETFFLVRRQKDIRTREIFSSMVLFGN